MTRNANDTWRDTLPRQGLRNKEHAETFFEHARQVARQLGQKKPASICGYCGLRAFVYDDHLVTISVATDSPMLEIVFKYPPPNTTTNPVIMVTEKGENIRTHGEHCYVVPHIEAIDPNPHHLEEFSMTLRPLADRIVCTRKNAPEKSGSIIIPENAKEAPAEFKVEAVGPGKRKPDGEYEPVAIEVGDVVVAGQYAGIEVKVAGQAYVILNEHDVLAVLEPPPAQHESAQGNLAGVTVS